MLSHSKILFLVPLLFVALLNAVPLNFQVFIILNNYDTYYSSAYLLESVATCATVNMCPKQE